MTGRDAFAAAVDRVLALRDADPGCIGDSDVQAILAAADAYRSSALREFAAEVEHHVAGMLSEPNRSLLARLMDPSLAGALRDVARVARERAEAITTGTQPVAEGDGRPAVPGEAQRGSQGRRGWDQ